jgi:hypothetical protein
MELRLNTETGETAVIDGRGVSYGGDSPNAHRNPETEVIRFNGQEQLDAQARRIRDLHIARRDRATGQVVYERPTDPAALRQLELAEARGKMLHESLMADYQRAVARQAAIDAGRRPGADAEGITYRADSSGAEIVVPMK